jgi:hypothetical protein
VLDVPSQTSSGVENTAVGFQALYSDVDGAGNTAIGSNALYHNASVYNTATGDYALYSNTTGTNNTATGARALSNNTTANSNTANGFNALANNTTGSANTADGNHALYSNTAGSLNTAEGAQALDNSTGSNNVGLGFNAGHNLTTGSGNVCIGAGVLGVAGENNTTRIRNVYSSVATQRAVYVTSNNKIGTLLSSRRYKDDIKPMDKASEAILALKPVRFHYKREIEPNGATMFGLVAEDVEKVDRELVSYNEKGQVEAVRYDAVNAMLLNEFLKEHRKVEQLEKQVENLTVGLQKVSAQLNASKSAPQVVNNNQ